MLDARDTSPNTQSWLMDRIAALGYSSKSKGICFGLSSLAVQAALVGQLDVFIRRIQLIKEIPIEKFQEHINTLQAQRLEIIQNVKKEASAFYERLSDLAKQNPENDLDTLIAKKTKENLEKLDKDMQIALEIPNFFDAIVIGQAPALHPDLFPAGTNLEQGMLLTTPLTRSQKLEQEGGIAHASDKPNNPTAFSGVYDEESLDNYFSSMEKALQITMLNKPVVLILVNSVHAIAVIAMPGEEKPNWLMIDANQLHLPISEVSTTKAIASQVFNAMKIGGVMDVEQSSSISFDSLMSAINAIPSEEVRPPAAQDQPSVEPQSDAESIAALIAQFNQNSQKTEDEEEGFFFDDSMLTPLPTYNHVIFSTEIYADKASDAALKKFLTDWKQFVDWKQLHEMSPDKAKITDAQGGSWLYIAVRTNDLNLAEQLLKHGADPNNLVENGNSPLNAAVANNNIDLARLLLLYHANPNISPEDDYSTLQRAVYNGNVAMTELLLSHEMTNPNLANKDGNTPLHLAVMKGDARMVKLLLSHEDTNPNAILNSGKPPLWLAIENGNIDIAELLLSHSKTNPNMICDNISLLWFAIIKQQPKMVESFLSHQANPNVVIANTDVFPLFFAAEKGNTDLVNVMLSENRTDLTQDVTRTVETLRTFAKSKGHHVEEAMEKFIERKTNGDHSLEIKIKPAEIAAIMGHIEIEKLINHHEMQKSYRISQMGIFSQEDKSHVQKEISKNESDKKLGSKPDLP